MRVGGLFFFFLSKRNQTIKTVVRNEEGVNSVKLIKTKMYFNDSTVNRSESEHIFTYRLFLRFYNKVILR